MTNPNPEPVDLFVGDRIRTFRSMMGLTQSDLGERAGVTFQQVQKYERGVNRVSASRLHALARVLKRPVADFFPPADGEVLEAPTEMASMVAMLPAWSALGSQDRRLLTEIARSLASRAKSA